MKRLQARPVERSAWRAAGIFGALIAAIAIAAVATPWPIGLARATDALVVLGSGKRTESIVVATGKSQNIRTDSNFVDVVVGDSEIADVMPLTDHSLSILGKKIGTTRVSVYAEGKKLVGVFDIEVSYDIPKLAAELRQRFPQAQFRVSSVNGRIMLSGTCADGPTLDKAVTIARQFGPDVINSVQVLQPLQVLLEVRFVEIQRTAARELGINWKVVADNVTATVGQAGLISGSPPFGSVAVIGGLLAHGVKIDAFINALEERDIARRLAEPNLVALSGDTASFLAGGEFPFPVSSSLGQVSIEFKRFGVGLAFTPTVLSDGVINLKIEPEVSQLDPTNVIQVAGTTIPSRRPAAEQPRIPAEATAVDRQRAGARRIVPQRALPEEGDGPRHHRHAAHRAADAAGRRRPGADRRRAARERRRCVPARRGRDHAVDEAPARRRRTAAGRPHPRPRQGARRCRAVTDPFAPGRSRRRC